MIVAASVPSRPSQPWFVSATSTQITLGFSKVSDNGGAAISSYVLYSSESLAETYTPVASYDGVSLEWTVSQSSEPGFITGSMYDFKVSAVNEIGESDLSNSVTIAMASKAAQPPMPTVNREHSTLTSVMIEWQEGV